MVNLHTSGLTHTVLQFTSRHFVHCSCYILNHGLKCTHHAYVHLCYSVTCKSTVGETVTISYTTTEVIQMKLKKKDAYLVH